MHVPSLGKPGAIFLQKKIDEMECKVAASMGSKCVSVCCPSPRLQSRAIGLIVHGAADSRKLRLKWRKIGSGRLFRASTHNGNQNRISRFFDAAPGEQLSRFVVGICYKISHIRSWNG